MGEDELTQVGEVQFGLQHGGGAPDHLCRVAAQHVDAQHLAGLGVEDELGQSRGLEAVLGHESTGHVTGDARGDDVTARFPGRGLGESDTGALGGGVDGPRDGVPAHHLAAAVGLGVEDVGGGHLTHAVGGVGQQAATSDVPDRPHARQVGAHPVVHDHSAAGVLQAGVLRTPPVDGGPATDGHQHVVGLDTLLRTVGGGPVHLSTVDGGDPAAELEGDVLQGLAELRGHVVVGEGDDLGQHLDDGDLGAEHGVQRGELHPDDAAADHGQAFRDLRQREGAGGVDDQRVVLGTGDGGHHGHRSGGEDHVGGGVGGAVDGDPSGAVEGAVAVHDGDPGLLLGGSDPTDEGGDHLVLPFLQGGPVDMGAVDLHPELGAVAGVVVGLGGPEKGFGGDASHVQAGTTQQCGLDEEHLLPRVAESLGGDVAAGAAAQHDDIVVGHCSSSQLKAASSMFSRKATRSCRKRAASAPSMTRWSAVSDNPMRCSTRTLPFSSA